MAGCNNPRMQGTIAELDELERIAEASRGRVEATVLARVGDFPLYALRLGSTSVRAPAVGFFAGVHGLERVGTHIVLSFLASLVTRLEHDESFHAARTCRQWLPAGANR